MKTRIIVGVTVLVAVQRSVVKNTTFSVVPGPTGCKRLTEYQIAGDSEGHGIPTK